MEYTVNWKQLRMHPKGNPPIVLEREIPEEYRWSEADTALEKLLDRLGHFSKVRNLVPQSSVQGVVHSIVMPLRQEPDMSQRATDYPFFVHTGKKILECFPKTQLIVVAYSTEEEERFYSQFKSLFPSNLALLDRVECIVDHSSTQLFERWIQDQMIVLSPQLTDSIYRFLLEKFESPSDSLPDFLKRNFPELASNKGLVEFDGGNVLIK